MRLSLLLSCLLLSACAMTGKSIKDVPAVDAAKIQVPPFSGLERRTLSLSIIDERKPEFKNNSEELRAELNKAITEALAKEKITVQASGANSLVVSIHDTQMNKFKEGCVRISGSLIIPKKAKLNAEASGCYELRHPFGFKMGTDITKAYEESLSLFFKNLDQALGQLHLKM
ncbi:hypothetical protein QJS83_13835 [Bdellovibrio sp. 22V]|uniref:hypothetical protein n=1 Tax=Bdellovibrio TaxID=958 RepID=UPI0025427EE5|nr:hypothetical protein [Bdellovibrio sp. 22V]WII71545.1 hypothetical protein QJS83_13835 [Bdellovibrio sp. 22V]